jgi:two-component system, sensor histidine kinase
MIERRAPAHRTAISILVVDDSDDNAEILSEFLQEHGHRVLTASNGASALELLDQGQMDVVLLDIGLPDMDGYEVATAIRVRFGDRVRLVATTGFSARETRDKARLAGFDAFLAKPFNIEDVEAALIQSAL